MWPLLVVALMVLLRRQHYLQKAQKLLLSIKGILLVLLALIRQILLGEVLNI